MQLSITPGLMAFSPRLLPAFRHLPPFIWHRPRASLRGIFLAEYVAHPLSEATLDAHPAPMSRPEVDNAVRRLTRGMVLPEAVRMVRGHDRRRRLTVPILVVFGRRDRPYDEGLIGRICRRPERHADRVECALVDVAAHFITDDAPADVADLALYWFRQAT